MSSLKTFFIRYSHFFTGNIVIKLLGFITLPILTRIFTTEQYGIVTLVATTIMLAVAISKVGLSNGLFRFYSQYNTSSEQLTIFSSTVIIRSLLFSFITALLYILLLPLIFHLLKINEKYIVCFFLIALSILVQPVNLVISNLLIINGKSIYLNILGFLNRLISFGLSLYFMLIIVKDLYGYFIGGVLADLILSIVLFQWFFKNYQIKLGTASRDLTINLIKFGIPLLLSEISYLLLQYIDRFMIVAYYDEKMLGIYSVGYNIAMYISDAVVFSLSYSIVPIYVDLYEKKGRQETELFLSKCMYYLLIAVIIMSLGYFAIAKDLLAILASKKYIAAAAFSPIILIGNFLLGFSTNILGAGLYLQKKSFTILSIMVASLVLNIIMNVIWLPKYGLMAAAVATLFAGLSASSLTVIASFRYIKIKFSPKTIVHYVVLSLLLLYFIGLINTDSAWINLLSKLTVGFLIVVSAILISEKEVRQRIKVAVSLRNDC